MKDTREIFRPTPLDDQPDEYVAGAAFVGRELGWRFHKRFVELKSDQWIAGIAALFISGIIEVLLLEHPSADRRHSLVYIVGIGPEATHHDGHR
jgi:hypothetical protein